MSHPQQTVIVQQAESNGLGVAGLTLSIIGFVTCGLLSPLGLLLSVLGLFGRPKGTAIAGTIIGGFGSIWLFAIGGGMLLSLWAMIAGVSEVSREVQKRQLERNQAIAAKQNAETETPPAIEPSTETPEVLPVMPETTPADEPPISASVQPATEPASTPPAIIDSPSESVTPVTPSTPEPVEEPAVPEFREWTSADGNFRTSAEFVSMTAGVVKLRKQDGAVISVPLESLSLVDQQWIKSGRAKKRP